MLSLLRSTTANHYSIHLCRHCGNKNYSMAEMAKDPEVRTILASVGRGGLNRSEDVRLVQELLNRHLQPPQPPLIVNGVVDSRLLAVLEAFQRRVVQMHRPDGRVDPGSPTFAALANASEQPATP